ncbi:hypothetical protein [Fundicoccus culcitae]|uniref:Uncharacterized protein n=1 Tax=Fundicoccus culcitae TaxID=2969821 RepID=A0ABY5P8K0_9LACT|nr:hypothetical protein [Fundicoccus culcitae]UUX34693.1 hypothetical protein NRE15_03310 [Fundicoccus culcitae]
MIANKKIIKMLTKDNALTYLTWSLGTLGVMGVIYLAYLILMSLINIPVTLNFANFSIQSALFAFVIFGIISAIYVIPDNVRLGLTRRQSVIGNLTGVMVATAVTIIVILLINGLFDAVVSRVFDDYVLEQTLFEEALMIKSGMASQWLGDTFGSKLLEYGMVAMTWFINLMYVFSGGWLVSVGFLRFGFFKGLGVLLIGLLLASINLLVRINIFAMFPMNHFVLNWLLAMFVSSLLIGISLVVTWQITYKMPIKLV